MISTPNPPAAPLASADPKTWPDTMLVRRSDASAFLKAHGLPVEPSTMANWRHTRPDGPPFKRFGRLVVYPVEGLRAFIVRVLEGV